VDLSFKHTLFKGKFTHFSISILVIFPVESLYIICYRIYRMCEFIGNYEDSKLIKKRMDKLAEEEPELEKVEEQPLVASK
jgi:hypothetical protein